MAISCGLIAIVLRLSRPWALRVSDFQLQFLSCRDVRFVNQLVAVLGVVFVGLVRFLFVGSKNLGCWLGAMVPLHLFYYGGLLLGISARQFHPHNSLITTPSPANGSALSCPKRPSLAMRYLTSARSGDCAGAGCLQFLFWWCCVSCELVFLY